MEANDELDLSQIIAETRDLTTHPVDPVAAAARRAVQRARHHDAPAGLQAELAALVYRAAGREPSEQELAHQLRA